MGSESIDLSLENIWRSWFTFRKGKNFTAELHTFQYHLEKNLYDLFCELNSGQYRHGGYRTFVVCDNKRREISVSTIRDRVVHRIIYDYLNEIYDKTFIYDAWSCRVGKGLLGAIQRIQIFLQKYPNSYIWKADVKKFFDSVDHEALLNILSFRIKDEMTIRLKRNENNRKASIK
jgi:retron-type reverse transcriptase